MTYPSTVLVQLLEELCLLLGVLLAEDGEQVLPGLGHRRLDGLQRNRHFRIWPKTILTLLDPSELLDSCSEPSGLFGAPASFSFRRFLGRPFSLGAEMRGVRI